MIPLDKGMHFSKEVAKLSKIIEASGLPNILTPMSTIVEGDWDEVFNLINNCRKELRRDSQRVSIKIWVDDREGVTDALSTKVKKVEDAKKEL
jgi:uncharacterized protein (TIGR00106 family)